MLVTFSSSAKTDESIELFRFAGQYGQTDLAFRFSKDESYLMYTGLVEDPDNIPEETVWTLPIPVKAHE